MNYLDYLSLPAAIPPKWKHMLKEMMPDLSMEIVLKFDNLLMVNKPASYMY